MKRITILSLYDVFNQVDYCTQKLICDIRQYSDYLFIVCNFSSDADVDEFLRKNSDYVLIRDNTGFDGGAIKDAISVLLSNKTGVSINDFDEILILNDTFYGFFSPIQPFFDWFRGSDIDFAGFTKNDGGYLWRERLVPPHVQGYAIIVKKHMFLDDSFAKFWRDFDYPKTTTDNIFNFEYRFSEYFSKLGFKFDAYYDLRKYGLTKTEDVDYLDHPYELINYEKFPVFKYKAAWIDYMNESSYKALSWIKDESPDAFEKIMKHVEKSSGRMYFKQDDLRRFCKNKQGIYIYGNGILGKQVNNFLKLMDFKFMGYVVTSVSDEDRADNVLSIADIDLERNEGIIVGMNKTNALEVRKYLDLRFDLGKVFYPSLY